MAEKAISELWLERYELLPWFC